MEEFLYEHELVTGSANSEVMGSGLTSTSEEQKHLVSVCFVASARQANDFRLYHERERIADIDDSISSLAADIHKDWIEIDREIPIGDTIKPAVNSGGTANNLTIIYKYKLVGV